MKAGPLIVLMVIIFAAAAEAAKIPPPVSVRCRIRCVVAERAEWKTGSQSANELSAGQSQVQTSNSNPVLIINSDSESILEIDDNGQFHSGNSPIEIITSPKAGVNTITACWKM